jgi:hypothetical protein
MTRNTFGAQAGEASVFMTVEAIIYGMPPGERKEAVFNICITPVDGPHIMT